MIQELVDRFNAAKDQVRAKFAAKHPDSYKDVVRIVIDAVAAKADGPDPERIHEIDDGEYQGTLLYMIAARGYQPYDYYYVRVSYGSCSGCDTLQAIHDYGDEPPNESQVSDYMTLALHVVQGIGVLPGYGEG